MLLLNIYVLEKESPSKEAEDSDSEDMSPPPSPSDDKENIKQKFLVDMPHDFYLLWNFAKNLNTKKPTGTEKAKVSSTQYSSNSVAHLLYAYAVVPMAPSIVCHLCQALQLLKLSYSVSKASLFKLKLPMQASW